MAAGKVVEVSRLTEKFGSNSKTADSEKMSTGEVTKHLTQLQGGSAKKDDVVDSIQDRVNKIADLPSDDFDVQDREEKGEFDWLVSKGKDATISAKAKNQLVGLVATLSDNLSSAKTASAALIYRKETAPLLNILFNTLSVSSEGTEDNLKYVQREIRNLLGDAISQGKASASLDEGSITSVIKMFSSKPADSIRATIELITNEGGVEKFTKLNTGFLAKLSQSYGAMGKYLAQYVHAKVEELTTRPLTMTSEAADDIDDDIKREVAALKEEVFNSVFDKIEKEFEKKKSTLTREGEEDDAKFIEEYRSRAKDLYIAEDRDSAERAAKELTEFLAKFATRAEQAGLDMQSADRIIKQLNKQKSAKNEGVVAIPSSLIGDAVSAELKTKLAELLVTQAQAKATEADEVAPITKEQMQKVLSDFNLKEDSPAQSLTLSDGTVIEGITSKHVRIFINGLRNDLAIHQNIDWGSSAPLTIGGTEVTPKELAERVKQDLEAKAKAAKEADKTEAQEVVVMAEAGAPADKIIKKARTIFLPLSGASSEGVKKLAEELKTALAESKGQAKKDKKYYEKFTKDMNTLILRPILTKAPTISSTNGAALLAAMVSENGELNEDFFTEAFKPYNDTASDEIKEVKQNLEADIEARKKVAESSARSGLANMLNAVSYKDYDTLITNLRAAFPAAGNEGDPLPEFKNLLVKASLNLKEDETKALDTTKDSTLNGYDKDQIHARRVSIITAKLAALKEMKDSKSSRIGDAKPDIDRVFSEDRFKTVDKKTSKEVQTIMSRLDREHFDKIDGMQKDIDALADLEVDDNIWELDADEERTLPKAVQDILKNLKTQFKQGLKNILGSMGLFTPKMVNVFKEHIGKIDEESTNTGLLTTIHGALTAYANEFGGGTTVAKDHEPAQTSSKAVPA